jgi:hypothetical protein
MVTAPEDNRNFFILKPLLDQVFEELVMCSQIKLFWLCPQIKRIPFSARRDLLAVTPAWRLPF